MLLDTTNLKKTNIPGYFKDPRTGAILNGNESEYRAFKAARENILELRDMKLKHTQLQDDMQAIKKALGI